MALQRLLVFFILTLLHNSLFATDFESDGLLYLIRKNNEVSVLGKTNSLKGKIIIPEKVLYQGTTYTVTMIDDDAFSGETDITSIVIPKTIGYINESAFWKCVNIDVVYASSLESWLNIEFENSSSNPLWYAKHLIINGVEVNDDIVIPEGTKYLWDFAFSGYVGLKSVTLPSTLISLDRSFVGCSNLQLVISKSSMPAFVEDRMWRPFHGISTDAKLIVPKGSKEAYLAVPAWSGGFKEIIEETNSYSLSITAKGNGSVSYDGTIIKEKTSIFTVTDETSAIITFIPDNGYCIKSLYINNTDVTSSVSNNQYTVSNILRNTMVEVEFEAIPPTTYTLSVSSTGGGYASYGGTAIRSKTSTFTVNEGTNATISFNTDSGYRIRSVKVNGSNVTSSVSNTLYTVSNIQRNTTVEVEFEAIPPTTYTLSISSTGSGYASYGGTAIRSKTSTFTVNEGTNATISFNTDSGYRIKSVKVNGSDVTSSVSNNRYTVSNILRNTTVEVEFEAIPPTTYTLSVSSTGSGYASYGGIAVRSKTSAFTVIEGSNATILFNADSGYRIKSVKVNGSDVTSSVSNSQYTVSNIQRNTTVEVGFQEELKAFASNGVNYSVISYDDKTVSVANGNYGKVLEVPATITYQDIAWKVAGIDNTALADNDELAAVIWNPTSAFTLHVNNPNLLLYVKSASYAPESIKNVIVDGTADNIVLTDASDGNNFYCPMEFTAKTVSYTHGYSMETGIGESRGWETIALPFDVQKIAHSSKGEIVPFAKWKSGDTRKPFWLMAYGTGGFTAAEAIKANTPYIISMPNHTNYKDAFRLNGSVTFSAENVKVKASDTDGSIGSGEKRFVPNFINQDNSGAYVLNVNNDYVTYNGGTTEGSRFIVNLRSLHPFEAYMTTTNRTRKSIAIDDDMATGIEDVIEMTDDGKTIRVYNRGGQLLKTEEKKSLDEVKALLRAGVYIINGKKVIIR